MPEALLRFEFLQHAVLAILLGSVACGLIGGLLFVNRLSSLSGGISHAVFGGLGLSLLAGIPPLAGASAASIIAALLLGFILGPMMEENLRRALLLSRGDWSVFVTRPLSAGLLVAAALLLAIVLLPSVKNKREEAFVED